MTPLPHGRGRDRGEGERRGGERGAITPSPAAPRFRADHVGSLLRPPELIAARHARREGRLSAEALREVEDRAILEAVALQERVGLPVVTDGEFRRGAFFSRFVYAVEGLTIRPQRLVFRNDAGERVPAFGPYAAGRLRRARPICVDEFAFVRKATTRTPKVTMPAPGFVNFLAGRAGADPVAYPDLDEYFGDLARVYREEIAALAAAGCTYVQLDEVPLAMMGDPEARAALHAAGEDPERLTDAYVRAIAEAVRDRPASMTVALHLCRGNYRGRWLAAGGYDPVAARVLTIPSVDLFLLEYDSPRAGDFGPLAALPRDKRVMLGLVTTKSAALESPDALRRRIDEAARVVGLDRLGLCPQCGFGTNLTGSPMSVADEEAKLRLVVEVAREVWG